MGHSVPTIALTVAELESQVLVKKHPVSIGLPACDIDDWDASENSSGGFFLWDADYLVSRSTDNPNCYYHMEYPFGAASFYPYMHDEVKGNETGALGDNTYAEFTAADLSSPTILFTVDTSDDYFTYVANRSNVTYKSVTLSVRARRTGATTLMKIKLIVRHDGVYYFSDEFTLTGAIGLAVLRENAWKMTTRPWDGQPWVASDFNQADTQFGLAATYKEAGTQYMLVSTCRLWVETTADTGIDCADENDDYLYLCGDRTGSITPVRSMFEKDAFNLPVNSIVDYIRITAIVKNIRHWYWCNDGNDGTIHTSDGYVTILASADACGSIESSPSDILKIPNTLPVPDDDNRTETEWYALSYILTQNPSTATSWTFTDVETLTIGLEGAANSSTGEYVSDMLPWGADYYRKNWGMQTVPGVGGTVSQQQHYYWMTDGSPDSRNAFDSDTMPLSDPSIMFTVDTSHAYFLDVTDKCDLIYNNVTFSIEASAYYYPIKFKLFVCHDGIYYFSNEFSRLGVVNWIIDDWVMTTRPWDGQPWETNDFNMIDTQFGIVITDKPNTHSYLQVRECGIKVDTEFAFTEIRCKQLFASAVYHEESPPPCYLPKPIDIQVDHQANTEGLNFWSGNREVYSLGRSSKRTTRSGTMWDGCTDGVTTCEELIDCVRALGKKQKSINITGLRYNILNCAYNIISFSWVQVKEKPNNYDWSLELEFKKDVCV